MSFEIDKQTSVQHLSRIFATSRNALARLIARFVKPHDVEDIVQETYVRIYQASQRTRIYRAHSFMLQTARNLALNHAARADALNHVAVVEESDESEQDKVQEFAESAESVAQSQEEFLLFCRALRDLSNECRRAFILRKVYDLPQREVARRLGIAESTVEKHIARGLTASSEYLKRHGYQRLRRKERAAKNLKRKEAP